MNEKTIEELKKEADDLGIAYGQNIGAAKLAEKIEAFYAAQETSRPAVLAAVARAEQTSVAPVVTNMGALARQMEEEARTTHVVTIIDNDQRENNVTTTVSVSCGNEWFDLGTVRIPLNMPVEVLQGHINVLKEIIIPHHVKGQDGETVRKFRPRYSVTYQDELKNQ